MNLPRFSVRQTVLVNLLFFVCVLGGWAAFQRIPVEFFPDLNLNTVTITTVWSGASAEEVERLVTQKLEKEIGRVSDIDEMRSTSRADLSTIVVDFDENLDEVAYESALNDVRAALDRARDLPSDAKEPVLLEIKSSEAFPSLAMAVVDEGGVGETALREVARDLRGRVERIPGVNRASIRGALDREIRVLVDRAAAARYGLGIPEIADRLRRQNLNLPAGTVAGPSGEVTLRAQGDFPSLESIARIVVRESARGPSVRLGEVARVEEGLEKRRFINRYGSHPAWVVVLTRKSDADVIDLVRSVDEWLDRYRERLPAGVAVYKTLDTAAFVDARMQVLKDNLVTGIAFVIAILWFTIGFRNALLTTIAIPFSFLTAMIFFPMLDITINATTLIGMLLVSGMLVDDAIIVLENVYRRVEEGLPIARAVVEGTEEVMWPVVAAVATTCAAFAPLLLVQGTAGKFVSILPKAVIVCLAASLFECLLILPAHYLHMGSHRRGVPDRLGPSAGPVQLHRLMHAIAVLRGAVDAAIIAAREAYSGALDRVLAHAGAFGALFASLLLLAFAFAKQLPVDLFPGEFDTINLSLEAPPDFSLTQTDHVVRGVEREMDGWVGRDIVDYSTNVGMNFDSNYDFMTGPNLALSFLTMRDDDRSGSRPERLLLRLRERMQRFQEAHPEGLVELRVEAQQNGPPIGPPVEVRIASDDYRLGKAVAEEMAAYLRRLPGVMNVGDNLKRGPREARLRVDAVRAAQHGLRFDEIAGALRAANDGLVASSFRDPARGEDVDIRVLLDSRDREGLADLLDVEIVTAAGYPVRLRDVADVEVARGFLSFRRYDERRTVSVTADVDKTLTTSLEVNRSLQAAFADINRRYPEVEVRYEGEYQKTNEALSNILGVLPVAILGIYMILAALFRSYVQPIVVSVAIPFGLAGIALGVGLFGYKLSFVLLYASIGLVGVVVNDSLVMVDFINRARAGGMPLLEAVRQSGARRFRPILLTTLTTVVALLPMAFGLQGESKTYGPFAAAICFGLMVAMAGTLFAVPLVYTGLIVWQERLATWFAAARGIRRERGRC